MAAAEGLWVITDDVLDNEPLTPEAAEVVKDAGGVDGAEEGEGGGYWAWHCPYPGTLAYRVLIETINKNK